MCTRVRVTVCDRLARRLLGLDFVNWQSIAGLAFEGKFRQVRGYIIGASLSEPHTSVTALRTCVSIYLSMDRPLTINFKSAHSNISR